MKKIISLILALTLTLSFSLIFSSCGDDGDGATDNTANGSTIGTDPIYVEMMFAANENGEYGSIVLKLDPVSAPKTVENFVNLVNAGFYNGRKIFRSVQNTLIQGGCPNNNGTGNSVTKIPGEFSANGYEGNRISHTRGTISMARVSNDYDSASCQFFIIVEDEGGVTFDGQYAAFGHVIKDMEVVDKIEDDTYRYGKTGTGIIDMEKYMVVIEYARVLENYAE